MTHRGRCYCGHVSIEARAVQTVAYCHCEDCKRWTGAPLPAFAAVSRDGLTCTPDLGEGRSFAPGVQRWNCPDCGSPLAATFDYLPGQTYIPLGLFDGLDALGPAVHCHADKQAAWLHISDDLPRRAGSARAFLTDAEHD